MSINDVRFWGYQIRDIDSEAGDSVDILVASAYDMLVLEPTRTDWSILDNGDLDGSAEFDTADMVARLKASMASDGEHRKLVIAYIDIGEAEDWRWYWDPSVWTRETEEEREDCGITELPASWPDWIVARDPDCYAGNYPVAYWDDAWKDIVIYGTTLGPDHSSRNFNSIIDEVIVDGFDGIYLDWVEAFKSPDVIAAAQDAGKDPVVEMVNFIREMRTYAELRNPNFLIIQQNAADLIFGGDDNRETVYNDAENDFENVEQLLQWDLLEIIDAIAQEGVWYDGFATDEWTDCDGFDNNSDEAELPPTEEYLDDLTTFYESEGITVFTCEYAHDDAASAYALSAAQNFVGLATHRPLTDLTDTPPPGYSGPAHSSDPVNCK